MLPINENHPEKITIELPAALYHALRNEAKRQGLDLPDFVRRKIDLKPSDTAGLSQLSVSEILARTVPAEGEDRLDFFR